MHLTPQELQALLFGTADSTTTIADSAAAQEAQQHLSGCAVCQSVAKKYTNADSVLRGLILGNKGPRNELSGNELFGNKGTPDRPKRGTDCPVEQTWPNLAAGLIKEEEAARYVTHAAQCDWCGPLLKESMEDLAQDATAEEQEALAKLPSASPDWQRQIAKKMVVASGDADAETLVKVVEKPPKRKEPKSNEKAPFGWWPKLLWAGAGLAVVIVAVLVGTRLTREADVNQLLAQAYTEQRTIELRMPGAAYGPMRVERGGGKRDLPVQFYVAEGTIKRELSKHPEDPNWLQAQARAHLLEWNYEKAIQDLDDALMLKPNDPGLLIDKATALFQRGEKRGTEGSIDYGEAAENLSRALKQEPRDGVALFNRAILYDRLRLPNEAIADLEKYLGIESSGPWADDARARLEQLRKLVQSHVESWSEPLTNPLLLVRLSGDPAALAHADERIEEYQDLAISEWLPVAFPAAPQPPDSANTLAGLRVIAELLAERHRDSWLNDLLNSANRSFAFASGISALSKAIKRSNEGDPTTAYLEAKNAEMFFLKAGNRAGVQRAEVEQVHALQRSQHGDQCLAKAILTEKALRDSAYPWMHAQLHIDEGSCSIMLGRFSQARLFIGHAEKEAHEGRYRTMQLRRVGIAAAVETDEGNLLDAWGRNMEGLDDYWKGRFSAPVRAQQFYTDLSLAAEELRQFNLALAMGQEGARAISLTGNKSSEALTYTLVGRAAFRALDFELASAEFKKSNDLLSELPPSESTRTYRMDAEIDLAGVELEEGKLDRAEERLKVLREDLDVVQSYTIPLRFHETYGQLLAKQNRLEDAQAAFVEAVHIADSSLQGLSDPSDRYTWSQETSSLYRQLVQLELRKGDPEIALAVWERYRSEALRSPVFLEGSFNPSSSYEEIHKIIPSLADQTVISFAVLPEGLAIWVFDNRGVRGHFRELDSTELVRMTAYFADMCGDPSSDLSQLRFRARALYNTLIGPISEFLPPARTVVVESDDMLGNFPFEVLIAPDNRYWGDVHALVFSPGIFYENHLRISSGITSNTRVLAVASAVIMGKGGLTLDPIAAQVESEAIAVAARFSKATLLKGSDASFAQIEASLPAAGIFHFAGHAISTGRQEGLWLFKESGASREVGVWGADRINATLFKNVQLAVLAACSTGQGNQSRVETHGNVVRRTLLAGVPHIVASRWDVDSAATMRFMNLFYDQILSGKPISTAVQMSEAALRDHPETQHPYYWAAFASFGRSN
jgi:CHAT domain-containing protein